MYCDLWPYVLSPLDFQIQRRIVSAETIRWNTVNVNWDAGNLKFSQCLCLARPRHRLKIEYLFLFEILSKIDLFMFIVKSMHYAPQLSGIVCAAWKVSGTFTTSATAVTTGKCSKGFEVSSICCDLLKNLWLVLSCELHGNNSTARNLIAKHVLRH